MAKCPNTIIAINTSEAERLFQSFPASSHLLLAVSGGSDSLAMMQLAFLVSKAGGSFKVSSATVDHGLRAEAAREARYVAEIATKMQIPHSILCWRGDKPHTRLQEKARDARYSLLFNHARDINADYIVTAHTLDDQAETILFRMARGSGVSGLAGMKTQIERGGLIHARPLLGIAKERLIATCQAHNLVFIEDSSNLNVNFTRVRIRQLLPHLNAEGLTAQRFADLSARVSRIDEALEWRVDQLLMGAKNPAIPLNTAISIYPGLEANYYCLAHIKTEPSEIVLRVLLRIIQNSYSREVGQDYRHIRLNRVEAVLEEFQSMLQEGQKWRKSIAGLVLSLDKKGILKVSDDPRLKTAS